MNWDFQIESLWKNVTAAAALAFLAPILAQASQAENPLFGYTHLLPSPLSLPAGRLVFGTNVGIGITDFLEIETAIVPDLYQVFNVEAKISIVNTQPFALALTGGWQTYNLHDLSSLNPDEQITSWLPGAVAGIALGPTLALFLGGNLEFTNVALRTNGVETSGYVQGSSVESDLSWAYSADKQGVGDVLSVGASYDITYKLAGFGLSHHWRGLQLGLHYYPGAAENKILPIIAGGAGIDF